MPDKLPSFIEKIEDFPHLRIVRLCGEIDLRVIPEVQSYFKAQKFVDLVLSKSVVLDLRKVTQLDTSAIAGLVSLLSGLKKRNFRLAVMNAPDSMKDQLEMLKLDKLVAVFDSRKGTFSEILKWSEDW